MNPKNNLNFELDRLESRLMMAGDVSVEVTNGGDLIIEGDNANNQIKIVGVGDNFRIIGEAGTKINGQNFLTAQNVTDDVRIDLNNGNNSLNMLNVNVADDLTIEANDGKDEIDLNRVTVGDDANLNLRDGTNTFVAYDSSFGDQLTVRTGNDNDSALTYLTDVGGRANFQLGNGDDNLDVVDSQVSNVARVNMRAGNDVVNFDNSTGKIRVNAGSGTDQLFHSGENNSSWRRFEADANIPIEGVQAFTTGNYFVSQTGNDTSVTTRIDDVSDKSLRVFGTPSDGLRLFGVGGTTVNGESNFDAGTVTYLTIFQGVGNDRVGLVGGETLNHVNVYGQGGDNRFDIDEFEVGTELAFVSGNGDDFVSTYEVTASRFIDIYTNGGSDHVNSFWTTTGFQPNQTQTIDLGSGDDSYMSVSNVGNHTIRGQSGNDNVFMNAFWGVVSADGGADTDVIYATPDFLGTFNHVRFEVLNMDEVIIPR